MTRFAIAAVALLGLGAFAADPKPAAVVAVLYFDVPDKGHDDLAVFRKGLAEMLITDLVDNGQVRVVERSRLEEVLAELKLSSTGKIDAASAQRIGKLIGAKYQVMGSIIPNGTKLFVETKIVRVETAETVKTARVQTNADDIFEGEQKLARHLQLLIAEADAAAPPPEPPKKAAIKLKYDTALKYAQALDAKDKKDSKTAIARLNEVVKEQPEFLLAKLDLVNLTK